MADGGCGYADEGKEVVGLAFITVVEASAASQNTVLSITHRCRPSRWEDSMPLRAMRWRMPRSRSQRRRWS